MKFLRYLLLPFSFVYGLILRTRNLLFDWGILKSYSPPLPTICIGNLSMGGTGKTPQAEYLIRLLGKDVKLATLSRGYGRNTKGFRWVSENSSASEAGDEPLQFKMKFGSLIRVAVCEKRSEGIRRIMQEHPETQLILLDDAFQHRQVKAGLNILLSAYHEPFFNDFVLPAGNLREPRSGARRADAVVITKCPENLSEAEQSAFRSRIPRKEVFFSFIRYAAPLSLFGDRPLDTALNSCHILLLSGIADSSAFENRFRELDKSLICLKFADHHDYSASDMDKLTAVFESMSAKINIIVTTEKDAMRLRHPQIRKLTEKLPIYYVPIHVEFSRSDSSRFQKFIFSYVNENKGRG